MEGVRCRDRASACAPKSESLNLHLQLSLEILSFPELQTPGEAVATSPSLLPQWRRPTAASNVHCCGAQKQKLLSSSCFLICCPCFQRTGLHRKPAGKGTRGMWLADYGGEDMDPDMAGE